MQHRWMDLNEDQEIKNGAAYLGGTGPTDLWLTNGKKTLVCQYQDDDDYVSYQPADRLLVHVQNELLDTESNSIWTSARSLGYAAEVWGHDPKAITHYLLCFAPWVFTDTTRAEMLAALEISETTNQQGETI